MAYIVCTSNLDLVSFLFVPALYSTLKLEIFPFTLLSHRSSTVFDTVFSTVMSPFSDRSPCNANGTETLF